MAETKRSLQSLDQALSVLALEKLSKKKPEEFLSELKQQGIGSLEDLVQKTLESARTAAQLGSVAFDDEIHGICYKFSTYRPHFDAGDLGAVINVISEKLIR
jgi:hypothetical protein